MDSIPREPHSQARSFATKFTPEGATSCIDEAIAIDRGALALFPVGHPYRSSSLNNLANRLSTRYNTFGAMEDLNQAIVLDREALALCPVGHPYRSSSLSNLADCLRTRLANVSHTASSIDLSAVRSWVHREGGDTI